MADQFVLDQSTEDIQKEFIFTQKKYVMTTDSNNTNYSQNQVIMDLANLANSGSYINFLQSYQVFPLVLAVNFKADTDNETMLSKTDAIGNNLLASLKNGSYQIINSVNVLLGSNEVVSIVPYQNLKINYEIVSSWCQDDVDKVGASLHFQKESGDTMSFSSTVGSNNNKIQGFTQTGAGTYAVTSATKSNIQSTAGMASNQVNTGRLGRMLRSNIAFDDTNITQLTNTATALAHGKDCCEYKATVAGATVKGSQTMIFYINATIRLADIHDYFRQAPLHRNSYYQITYNLNINSIVSYKVALDGVVSAYTVSSGTNTIPFQTSQLLAGLGNLSKAGTVTAQLTLGVGSSSVDLASTAKAHVQSSRLYACMMKFTPEHEARYLSLGGGIRTIKFMETFVQTGGSLSAVPSGGNVQVLLSGSFPRIRKLILFPFISASANKIGVNPNQSVFASEPATCSPYSYIEDFNVVVSGEYIYAQNQKLCYEQYQELLNDNSLNGSLGRSMNSGLLSQQDFENGYGFIVCDLSRKNAVEDNIQKSIVVNFVNKSLLAMDYIAMLFYEKEIMLNVSTGNLQF